MNNIRTYFINVRIFRSNSNNRSYLTYNNTILLIRSILSSNENSYFIEH